MQNTINQITSLSKSKVVLIGYKIFFLLSATQILLEDNIPYNVIDRNNYALPKLLIIFSVTIFLEDIVRILMTFWDKIPHISVDNWSVSQETDARLDNVPLESLITFLLERKWRPVIPAKETFWLTTSQHKKLWDNMERVGILVRWENNARVISDLHPEMIIDIMCRGEDSDQLKPLLIKKENTSQYTLSNHSSLNWSPSFA